VLTDPGVAVTLVSTPKDVVRLVGGLIRRADGRLARTAASNAAHSVKAGEVRTLEDVRAMRDLARLSAAPPASRTGVRAVPAGRVPTAG
jgi:hypothetical protein